MNTSADITHAQRAFLDYWALCGVEVDPALITALSPAPIANQSARAPRRAQRPQTTFRPEPVRQGASSVESALLHAKAASSLEALAEAITAFDHPLKAGARNMVFSRGHRDAPVMLIGEAPGAEEDAKATPFIGRSGQLLDRMLSTIGLGEDDVYITNVIPYRPPQNRSPSTEEIAVSRPFFERHIALKKPRVIVAIGGVAASALLKTETGITRLRGKVETVTLSDGLHFPCLPMLHPAFLLRNPSAKRATWLDLVTLRDVLSATS